MKAVKAVTARPGNAIINPYNPFEIDLLPCRGLQSLIKRFFHLRHIHYRPQRSCEGYVFTPVCQSFCSQGGGEHLGRYPLDQVHPPPGRAGTPLGPGTPPGRAGTPPRPGTPPGRYTPLARYTPWVSYPPGTRYTPLGRYTLGPGIPSGPGTHPPGPGTPPWTRYIPRNQVPPIPRDGYCRGRYAFYWNAFLFFFCFSISLLSIFWLVCPPYFLFFCM